MKDFISGAYTDESQVNKIRLCTLCFHFTSGIFCSVKLNLSSFFFSLFFWVTCLYFLPPYVPRYLFCTAIHITSLQMTVSVSPVISNDPRCSNHLSSYLSFHDPAFYSCRIWGFSVCLFFCPLHWLGCVRGHWMLSILRSKAATRKILLGYCIQTIVFVLGCPTTLFSAVQLFCADSRGVVCSKLNINSSW